MRGKSPGWQQELTAHPLPVIQFSLSFRNSHHARAQDFDDVADNLKQQWLARH